MKRVVILLIVCLALALPASAQQDKKKKKIADRKFWASVVLMAAATIASAESAARAVERCAPGCEVRNPLFGKRPNRGRIYGVLLPVLGVSIWGTYELKAMESEYNGKLWQFPVWLHTGVNGLVAWKSATIPKTGVCPARGEGCR